MTTCQSQKNITYIGCTIDDDGSLDPERDKINMLEAHDIERARIPACLNWPVFASYDRQKSAKSGQSIMSAQALLFRSSRYAE